MSSLLSYVWLSLKRGLGNYLRAEVLRHMGSPEAVYAADSTMLAQSCPSLRRQHIELLCDKSTDEAEQVITQCAREDIRILPVSDAAYPDRLRQIEDPPVVLYIRGRWPDFDTMPGIAVVGTRQATSYGVQVAGTIGAELAKAGFVTVSGMALGNDAAAHRGALRAGGLTVAVLAGGPDVCYPPQNRALMGDILLSGAVISEYPPGTEPDGLNYKSRNRIISGLCVATVIVEAGSARSGALITARHALDQSRDVYAVPRCNGRAAVQRVQRPHRAVRGRPAERPEGARARVCEPAARRRGRISCLYPPARRADGAEAAHCVPTAHACKTGSRAGNGGSGAGKTGVYHAGGTGRERAEDRPSGRRGHAQSGGAGRVLRSARAAADVHGHNPRDGGRARARRGERPSRRAGMSKKKRKII